MVSEPLRVGILGVAGISSKTAIAISHPETDCEVRAVASRSLEKAEKFINEFFLEGSGVEALGGYDALINSDLVDAVYIPLPTAVKKEWVIKALKAGKHVVLEKPVALTASDYEEILSVAYANNKFVMDGTMFPHHKRTRDILEYVADEKVGHVDRVECNFTFMTDDAWQDDNIRARKDGDPHGCIGDLGWYCICYGLMVFSKLGSNPKSAQVVDFEVTKHGVPLDATCVVRFEDKRVLWLHCGFKAAFRQRFEICGSQKSITLDDLVLPTDAPTSYLLSSSGLTSQALLTLHEREEIETDAGPVHEVLLWKDFGRICKGMGKTLGPVPENASEWAADTELVKEANQLASISLTNQKVVDALMESIEKGCASVDI